MVYASGYWKKQAREALRNHWLTALLIALIVELPGLLVQGFASFTGNDLVTRVQGALVGALSDGGNTVNLNLERFAAGLEEIQGAGGVWLMQGLNVVVWLLTPCLQLGLMAWLLGRLRKAEDPGVTGAFSRLSLFWKGIGLRLYVAWRVFLYMLPGAALSAAAFLPLWLNDGSSRISLLSAANTTVGLEYGAMLVTAVLGAIGALTYALAPTLLADQPEKGPIQAAKAAKQMARGRKGSLFALYVSFVLWYFLATFAVTLALDFFGSIPALMVQLLGSLALSVYLQGSLAAFYLGCRGPEGAPEAQEIPGEGDIQ